MMTLYLAICYLSILYRMIIKRRQWGLKPPAVLSFIVFIIAPITAPILFWLDYKKASFKHKNTH